MNPLLLVVLETEALHILQQELKPGSEVDEVVNNVLARLEGGIKNDRIRAALDKFLRRTIAALEDVSIELLGGTPSPAAA